MAKPYAVRLGRKAKADLRHIAEWYEERHPRGHERFVATFLRATTLLATFPDAGRVRSQIADIRSYPVHPYIVFYTVDAAHRVVSVFRILHSALDLDEHEALQSDDPS